MPRSRAKLPSLGRERLIAAASDSLARRGYHGTAVAEVLAAAATPAGVLYHHFPDGKDQLVKAAVQSAGAIMLAELDEVLIDEPSWADGVRKLLMLWGQRLAESGFESGCPVTSTAADIAGSSASIRQACAGAYESWISRLAEAIATESVDIEAARSRALLLVSAAEGALLLAKALRTTAPLDRVAAELLP